MMVRSLVTFRSDLSDDGVEHAGGFVEWPGRIHALVLTDILRSLGCEVSEMIDSNEHGWELQGSLSRDGIWMQVTPLDEVILMIEGASSLWSRLFARKAVAEFLELLKALDTALRADGRFHDIRWFTNEEYGRNAPGAPAPVGDLEKMAGYVAPPPRPWREWDHPWRDR